MERATVVLKQLADGTYKLPQGVTKEALLKYREVAQSAIARGIDTQGTQAARTQIIDKIIEQFF
jgi:hypothetical protein